MWNCSIRTAMLALAICTASIAADAQVLNWLLLYNEQTGAHATGAIDFGEFQLSAVNDGPFEPLKGDQDAVHTATTASGIFTYKRLGLFDPQFSQTIVITADGKAIYGPASRGCDDLITRTVALGNYVLCYHDQFGNGALGVVGRDGEFVKVFDIPIRTFTGYSEVIHTANHFFFYNRSSGATAVGQISRSSFTGQEYLQVTDTGNAAAGYTTLGHSGGDEVLLYDELSGRYETLRFRLQGGDASVPGSFSGFIVRMKQGTIARGLRTAISTQSAVMLYDPRNGNYTVGRFGLYGDFNIKSSGMTTPGFERVAVGTDRYLLFLDHDDFSGPSGKAAIGQITLTGDYREVRKLNVGPYNNVISTSR